MVNLFRDKSALPRYEVLAKRVSDIALHVHCNSVVALACLFHHRGLEGQLIQTTLVDRCLDFYQIKVSAKNVKSTSFNCTDF